MEVKVSELEAERRAALEARDKEWQLRLDEKVGFVLTRLLLVGPLSSACLLGFG